MMTRPLFYLKSWHAVLQSRVVTFLSSNFGLATMFIINAFTLTTKVNFYLHLLICVTVHSQLVCKIMYATCNRMSNGDSNEGKRNRDGR